MRLLEPTSEKELAPDEIGSCLARAGLVLFQQATVDDVRELLAGWTRPVDHPDQSEPGLTVIAPRAASTRAVNAAGFTTSTLSPHTDRSITPEPPSLLATVLIKPPDVGGNALLVDGARVLAALRRVFDEATIASLRLRDRDGGTTTRFLTMTDGLARIRFRDDELASPWCEATRRDVIAELRKTIAGHAEPLLLGPGDGYLLHNHRYLHGRSAFAGDRRLVRMLARIDDDHRHAWLNGGFRVADS